MKAFASKKRSVYFKTSYSSNHLRIEKIIKQLFPNLSALVLCKKTKTLGNFLAKECHSSSRPIISLNDFYCLLTLHDMFPVVYELIIVIIIVPVKPHTAF